MKILKPLMFVIAGIAIAFLVSFKNEEPKTEYCKIEFFDPVPGKFWIFIYYQDNVKEINIEKGDNSNHKLIQTINNLAAEGWKINATNAYVYSLSSIHKSEFIYLERIKQ